MPIRPDTNPSNGPNTVTPNPTPTTPRGNVAETGESTDVKRSERAADNLAHKAAKDEQDFDKDNSNLFSK